VAADGKGAEAVTTDEMRVLSMEAVRGYQERTGYGWIERVRLTLREAADRIDELERQMREWKGPDGLKFADKYFTKPLLETD